MSLPVSKDIKLKELMLRKKVRLALLAEVAAKSKSSVQTSTIKETISIEDFEDIEQTAELAHYNQKRRDGAPYITHPRSVRDITKKYYPNNLPAQALALIHDALEDGPKQGHITEEELRQFIRGSVRDPRDLSLIEDALDRMTHDKSKFPNYEDYLEDVFSNKLASIVKISDLIHNLSNNPGTKQILKYRNALKIVAIPQYIDPAHSGKLRNILRISQ